MIIHELKTWPWFFKEVDSGNKTFELRDTSDRDFNIGEWLQLMEWDPDKRKYTGRALLAKISYIMRNVLGTSYAIMSLSPRTPVFFCSPVATTKQGQDGSFHDSQNTATSA